MRRTSMLVIGWIVGCGPAVSSGDTTETDTTSGTVGAPSSSSGPSTTTPPPSTSSAMTTTAEATSSPTASSSTGDSMGTDETGCLSHACIDVPAPGCFACDVFEQDCPRGEKCTYRSCGASPDWEGTHCVPIDTDAAGVGEPCTVTRDPWSGIDDCELGSLCVVSDDAQPDGVCVAICEPRGETLGCADACSHCVVSTRTEADLCVQHCDPLAQNCAADLGCYGGPDSTYCAPVTRGLGAAIGEACELASDCEPGSNCVVAGLLPDCFSNGCCTPWCQVGAFDACALQPGTTCEPYFGDTPAACVPADAGLCVTLP